jgi:hypothetical protein
MLILFTWDFVILSQDRNIFTNSHETPEIICIILLLKSLWHDFCICAILLQLKKKFTKLDFKK